MEKYASAIVLVFFSLSVTAQDIKKSNAYYRTASRENRIIGLVFLGWGVGLIAAGTLRNDKDFGTGKTFLTIGGVLLCIASVPFFNNAAWNKRKIVTIGLKNQSFGVAAVEESAIPWVRSNHIAQIKNSRRVYKTVPAVSIKINL